MKKQLNLKISGKLISGAIIVAVLFSVNLTAKNHKRGRHLIIEKQCGQIVSGELLAVKNGTLVIKANSSGSFQIEVNDINLIKVKRRKARFLKRTGAGLLTGVCIGGGIGLLSGDDEEGFFSFTAGQKAVIWGGLLGGLGLVIGGLAGAASQPYKSIQVNGKNSNEIKKVLETLNKKARFKSKFEKDIF
jgi:hypothetical protein